MTNAQKTLQEASIRTAAQLKQVAEAPDMLDLSRLSLPEVAEAVKLVSRVLPAGNVPAIVLNGISRVRQRKLPLENFRRDVNLLFRTTRMFDTAVYTTMVGGPAAVIWGYQHLLRLAGKDPIESFPEGLWQFYVDYAMREDTARHTNETNGFDRTLARYDIELSRTDRITAWLMAAIHCLHDYDALLRNEWRERVYTQILQDITADLPSAPQYAQVYRRWEKQRPFRRYRDGSHLTYPQYRQMRFDHFFEEAICDLPSELRAELGRQGQQKKRDRLPTYQQQMSIRAYLEPDEYGENRRPLAVWETHIGLIHNDYYHLIPICHPNSDQPIDVELVRAAVDEVVHQATTLNPVGLAPLAKLRRANWPKLKHSLPHQLMVELTKLRTAPILFNSGTHNPNRHLNQIRQAERGIGDHALTMFDTQHSTVFDQSHIFFDGAWGAAFAEILTESALSWAVYLHQTPPRPMRVQSPAPLQYPSYQIPDWLSQVQPEASAETEAVDVKAILHLRTLFKQRNDTINLTVNDLLLLYRAIHAATYRPSNALEATLAELAKQPRTKAAVQVAEQSIHDSKKQVPAIVMPIDASPNDPATRLYPMTFEVPLEQLDFIQLHYNTVVALEVCQESQSTTLFKNFATLQRTYLATLKGFGDVMSQAKEIASRGDSDSVTTMSLLAILPPPLQLMLNKIPDRFETLNDLLRGREVFSNIGQAMSDSSLTRFITAKDDNEKKTLAWGVLTTAEGQMHVTLRDFRPHVPLLAEVGQCEVAQQIAQDYLDSYASGLNHYIKDLRQITEANRAMFEVEED